MKIVVKTKNTDFSMPVPLAMAELAINNMPESIFEKGREKMGPPYDAFITRELAVTMFRECKDIFRQNKGLEIIHAEGHDGKYISVVL